MPVSILFLLIAVIFGVLIGGVVNLMADRFAEKISLKEKCKCEKCEAELEWHDMVPLVSFLLLKGRCRSCGAKVNIRYPLVELGNGILYMVVFMANGFNIQSILYCLMTSAFLVISIVDERIREIPNSCNLFIGIIGLVVCIIDRDDFLNHIIGFVAVSAILFVLFQVSNGALIGGGDVKLMASSGLLLGWLPVTISFFLACIIGSVCHIIRMNVTKKHDHQLAMGPYLCIALWICALWGNELVRWYLGTMGL